MRGSGKERAQTGRFPVCGIARERAKTSGAGTTAHDHINGETFMRTRSLRYITAALAAAVLLLTAAVLIPTGGSRPAERNAFAADGGEMRVHFIDCGQADACFIQLPDGKSMLIDTGENKRDSYGAVIDYLGVTTIDYLILTHSDADHVGGATHVLEEYEFKTIYRPAYACSPESGNEYCKDPAYEMSAEDGTGFYVDDVAYKKESYKTYSNVITAVYEETYTENGETHKAEVYVTNPYNSEINHIEGEGAEYTFDFYSPIDVASYSDSNDFSPIMVLSYASRDFVMTGDAEKDNEADFVDYINNTAREGDYDGHFDRFLDGSFTADVIKMGHHGSRTSSSEGLLEIMTSNPAKRANIFTIFSCGVDNKYGHPHAKTLKRLMDMGFSAERIERTDLNGNIAFGVTADGTLTLGEEKTDVTIEQKLTTGSTDSRPQTTIADNEVDPDEAVDDLPDTRPEPPEEETPDPGEETPGEEIPDTEPGVVDPGEEMPDLFDPDTWARSPAEWHILQWVVIAVAVIVIIIVIAVIAVRAGKKKKRGGRRRR